MTAMITKRLLALRPWTRSLQSSQVRTAMILRRKSRPPYQQRILSPYVIGPLLEPRLAQPDFADIKDYIYDEVEDTETRPKGKLKLILLEHVEELGVPGDTVEVDEDEARFHLISARKADYYCDYNLKRYKDLIESGAIGRVGPSSAFVMSTVRQLAKAVILVELNGREEWLIQKWHLRIALRRAGYVVPEEAIQLPETPIKGPDVEGKEGKDFAVEITINNQEKVAVRCMIHHIGQPLKANWFRAPRIALLTEQVELLNSMPVQERLEEDTENEEQYIS